MNQLIKALYCKNEYGRIYQFINGKTGKTISYKVYDSKRRLLIVTDDVNYASKVLLGREVSA